MSRLSAVCLLLAALVLLPRAGRTAAPVDWNQWRGPGRDGRIPNFRPPSQWPSKLARRWKVDVGLGHSSPLAVGDGAYVFTREGENEVIRRLTLATGKEVWRASYAAPYTMNPAAVSHGPGPKSTPVLVDGRLYTLGISGILSCLDAQSGNVLWRHDFVGQYPNTSPLYGAAMSPLVDGTHLIAHVGGNDNGALTAFDARTGAARWHWNGDGPGYASPILARQGGARQVITETQKFCVGVSADDGKLLWSLPFATPFVQNAVTPVLAGDLIVFAGLRQPTFAARVVKEGGGWKVSKAWETNEATFYLSTPVLSGKYLYGMSERQSGQLVTLDAATGKTAWTGEARFSTNAALLDGGPVILALTTEADLFIFKKEGAALKQLARYQVAESPTWATPAVTGNRILVKDLQTLALYELPG